MYKTKTRQQISWDMQLLDLARRWAVLVGVAKKQLSLLLDLLARGSFLSHPLSRAMGLDAKYCISNWFRALEASPAQSLRGGCEVSSIVCYKLTNALCLSLRTSCDYHPTMLG